MVGGAIGRFEFLLLEIVPIGGVGLLVGCCFIGIRLPFKAMSILARFLT